MNVQIRIISFLLAGLMANAPVAANEKATETTMPQGLQQAYLAARHGVEQVDASDPATGYRAVNLGNHLRLAFQADGVEVSPRTRPNKNRTAIEPAWRWRMRLDGYGAQGDLRQPEAPQLAAKGDRITYQRGELQEWYHNGLAGLEQGFTLQRPKWLEGNDLELSFTIEGGLEPRWLNEGQALAFHTADGAQAFNYDALKAFDADGTTLPSHMELSEGGLSLRVDTTGAAWPVTIDPLIHIEDKLIPELGDAAADDEFGYASDIDGNLAIISSWGADDVPSNSGAAYIFERTGSTWNPVARLVASDTHASQRFGKSVAIDGSTALVGAYNDNQAGSGAGATYVFYQDEGGTDAWGQKIKLIASDALASDNFGWSVALDGDTALIGARLDNHAGGGDAGSAYIFYRNQGGADLWGEVQQLIVSDAAASDRFGTAVAIDGDIALVGADGNDDAGSGSGSAYLFYRDQGGADLWGEVKKIVATDAAASDLFGYAVALSGDTALVGAYHDDDWGSDSGSAYVFYKDEGGTDNWGQKKKLNAGDAAAGDRYGFKLALDGDIAIISGHTNSDGATWAGSAYLHYRDQNGTDNWGEAKKLLAPVAEANAQFGWDVAVSGGTAIVTAYQEDAGFSNAGAAYVFEQDLGGLDTWGEQRRLAAVVDDRDFGDKFGISVALDGNVAVVGADFGDTTILDSGAAYVFTRSGNTWRQQAKLAGSYAESNGRFGSSVALDGDTVLVGATNIPNPEFSPNSYIGTVFVYVRNNGFWTEQAKIVNPVGDISAEFGLSVALDGDTALVGTAGSLTNRAHVFTRAGSTWSEQARLSGSDAVAGDLFGRSVAVDGDTALVGAYGKDSYTGAAYIFTRTGANWLEQSKLVASDPNLDNYFGRSVALDQDVALIGASGVEGAETYTGAAYVFTRTGITWSQQTKFIAPDQVQGARFGESVSLDDGVALIGAGNLECDPLVDCGAAYLFQKLGVSWGLRKKLSASDSDPVSNDRFGWSVAISRDSTLLGTPFRDCPAGGSCGIAYVNRFECGFGGVIEASRWTMIGLPCELPLSDTVQDILGDNLDTSQYGYRWIVFRRDTSTDTYVALNLGDSLLQGEGYWVYSLDSAFWDVSGFLTGYQTSPDCGSLVGCYEIPLAVPGDAFSDLYNMIGNPFSFALNWSGVRVVVDGVAYKPHEADDMGYVDKNFWKYNGAGYDSYDDITLGMQGELDPHKSVWVRALGGSFGKTVSLLIPAGPTFEPPLPPIVMNEPEPKSFWNWSFSLISSAYARGKPYKPQQGSGWYLRLIAEAPAEGFKDSNTVLGQLSDSYETWDKHDLPELAPLSDSYLTVVFPHADWPFEPGDYSSDFHSPSGKDGDEWIFEVKSDDPFREVVLSWRGNYKLGHMWLEDVDAGAMVKAVKDDALQAYTFNMNGQYSRLFRWVMEAKGGKGGNDRNKGNELELRRTDAEVRTPAATGHIGLPPGIARK